MENVSKGLIHPPSEILKDNTDTEIAKIELSVGALFGNMYYKWNEEKDDFDMCRIVRIQNNETVVCAYNNDYANTKKIKLVDLHKEYSQLLSNAVLTISKVIIGTTPGGEPIYDIVVMVYKREDANTEFSVPDIICRQALSDIFYEPYCDKEENPMVGISVSKDTIPAGYTMNMLATCDAVVESRIINVYRTDTLDTLLSLMGDKWNTVLINILNHAYNNRRLTNPFLSKEAPVGFDGYCRDLRTLLETNNFMYDFYSLMGITHVKFIIDYDENKKENTLPNDQKEALQSIYEINIEKTMVLPFDYSIDLSRVKVPYLLIMDANNVLYFIAFTKSKDEYVKTFDTEMIDRVAEINKRLSEAVDFYDKYSK